MIATPTIAKAPAYGPYRNYERLRRAGIDYIERVSHQLWNDYNPTDPGVTMLEVLCYAITDLGMRMDMPLEDLLISTETQALHQQFHTALEVLPNAPVTELDYRKLFVNIRGVKNAWLHAVTETVHVDFKVDNQTTKPRISYSAFANSTRTRNYELRGLYDVQVEYEDDVYNDRPQRRAARITAINERIRQVFHRNRNLCEDLRHIQQVNKQEVVVCGEIELHPDAEANFANARILQIIQDYLAPSVPFYTLEELLAEGRQPEDIFSGPIAMQDSFRHRALLQCLFEEEKLGAYADTHRDELEQLLGDEANLLNDLPANLLTIKQLLWDELLFHGFIKTEDLVKSGLRRDVRTSDIIDLIMELEEVKEVRDLFIGLCKPGRNEEEECYCGDVDVKDSPWKICLDGTAQATICFQGSNFRFFKGYLPINVQKTTVRTLWQDLDSTAQDRRFSMRVTDIPLPQGRYQALQTYSAAQNDLPEAYGIGPLGLPPVEEDRYASRQAEAYQLKAYLMFFEQVLATYFQQLGKVPELLSMMPSLGASYYTQVVDSVKDKEAVFVNADIDTTLTNWIGSKDNSDERNHKRLDHLIGRFAERFSEYTYMLFSDFEQDNTKILQQHKADFLSDYPSLSSRRFCAYNYYESADNYWNTDNVSGLQYRLARLAGFDSHQRKNLKGGVTYEFYQEEDTDDESEFRWRIRDEHGKILLSSSQHYHRKRDAIDEMEIVFALAKESTNLPIMEADDGTWYFNVVNAENEVVGRRIEYFDTLAEAQNAKLYVVDYLQGKYIEQEGMYLVEHLLLRPDQQEEDHTDDFFSVCHDKETERCTPLDDYSFRMSVILPGWTRRFGNPDFRQFLERLIRLETPAHILPKICWVSQEDMTLFEDAYQQHLVEKAASPTTAPSSLAEFIHTLEGMRTAYWPGTLHDCVDEGSAEEDNPVILNRTFLGNLENSTDDGQ